MENVIIYISYDSYDYINYFHLIAREEILLKYIPGERVSELFDVLKAEGIAESEMNLQIVADENATDWNYENTLKKMGYALPVTSEKSASYVCGVLENVFHDKFSLSEDSTADTGIKIKYLYPADGESIDNGTAGYQKEELLTKAKKIMEFDQEEMTELARIIIEKYERMKNHE